MEASKRNKIILIVVLIALVALALYLRWKKRQEVAVATDIVTNDATVTTVISKFPLKAGSKSTEVKQLQAYLLKQGAQFPLYGVDGNWGSNSTETTNNVKKILNVSEVSEGMFKQLGMDKIKV